MAIEARVYDPTNTTYLGSLPLSLNREWRDETAGVGFGSCTVPTASDDEALLASDNVVRLRLNGVDRYAFICSEGDQVLADDAEEAGQLTTWSGPGLTQWFDESTVFPELGIDRLSPSERVFNFASTSYDDSAWIAATEIKQQADVGDDPYSDAPDDWPDEFAYWIWTRPRDLDPPGPIQPVGSVFFRRWFEVAEQTDFVMAIACDDGYEVWLDGERIAEEERAFLWGRTTEYGGVLDAGWHLVAVRATNIERDVIATNGAAFLLSILAASEGGKVLDPDALVRTDDTWVCLDYPDPWPTMTPGEIINVLLAEAGSVAELTWVSVDFTDSHDSDNEPWGAGVDVAVPVGSSILDVMLALSESSVDLAFNYATNTLSMYNLGTGGLDRTDLEFLTLMTVDPAGDWKALTYTSERAIAKRALSQLADERWVLVDSGAGGRPTTGFARLGTATSPMQVERVMAGWFAEHGVERVDFQGQLVPTPGKEPYEDFGLRDLITLPGWGDSGTAEARVSTIACTELDPGADGEIGGTQLFVIEGRLMPV